MLACIILSVLEGQSHSCQCFRVNKIETCLRLHVHLQNIFSGRGHWWSVDPALLFVISECWQLCNSSREELYNYLFVNNCQIGSLSYSCFKNYFCENLYSGFLYYLKFCFDFSDWCCRGY